MPAARSAKKIYSPGIWILKYLINCCRVLNRTVRENSFHCVIFWKCKFFSLFIVRTILIFWNWFWFFVGCFVGDFLDAREPDAFCSHCIRGRPVFKSVIHIRKSKNTNLYPMEIFYFSGSSLLVEMTGQETGSKYTTG